MSNELNIDYNLFVFDREVGSMEKHTELYLNDRCSIYEGVIPPLVRSPQDNF